MADPQQFDPTWLFPWCFSHSSGYRMPWEVPGIFGYCLNDMPLFPDPVVEPEINFVPEPVAPFRREDPKESKVGFTQRIYFPKASRL